MDDIVRVQVLFTISQDGATLNDALYFTSDQYAIIKQDDIESLKQSRFDKWKADVDATSPAIPKEPTKEELQKEADAIDEQVAQLLSRKEEIAPLIDEE